MYGENFVITLLHQAELNYLHMPDIFLLFRHLDGHLKLKSSFCVRVNIFKLIQFENIKMSVIDCLLYCYECTYIYIYRYIYNSYSLHPLVLYDVGLSLILDPSMAQAVSFRLLPRRFGLNPTLVHVFFGGYRCTWTGFSPGSV
jgi:hypothetical protein